MGDDTRTAILETIAIERAYVRRYTVLLCLFWTAKPARRRRWAALRKQHQRYINEWRAKL
jgi:hypothetical protein